MPDETALAVIAGLFVTKDLGERLLGPTADYLGEELRDFTKRRAANVKRIAERAISVLGPKLDEPGAVPPRVLKHMLDEGSFVDDAVAVDYFGGVLASSRTEVGRDDRGAAHAALLSRLSTYAIRTHYIFYTIVRRLYVGSGINLGDGSASMTARTFVPLDVYNAAMEFGDSEVPSRVLTHSFFALRTEDLVADSWWAFSDSPDDVLDMPDLGPDIGPGIAFQPTPIGAELYAWSYGMGDRGFEVVLDPSFDLPETDAVQIPDGAVKAVG